MDRFFAGAFGASILLLGSCAPSETEGLAREAYERANSAYAASDEMRLAVTGPVDSSARPLTLFQRPPAFQKAEVNAAGAFDRAPVAGSVSPGRITPANRRSDGG